MKTNLSCLREFEGLKEAEQSPYLITTGAALTLNAGAFTGIPNSGATITGQAIALLTTFGLRNNSDADMTIYLNDVAKAVKMMDENYDFIDLIAQGDGSIIALAGVKSTSANTARTGTPNKAANLSFDFVKDAGQIQIGFDKDKLSDGAVIVSFVDPTITVEKSDDLQLKITVGGTLIYVNLATTIKTIITNQVKGKEINSTVVLFNPNGFSPVASPESVIVPR